MLMVVQIFCTISLHSANFSDLFIGGLRFFKNHWKRRSIFPCKNGGKVILYRKAVYRRRDKHCFSLITCGFCSSNALYSASLSVRIFIFIFWLFKLCPWVYFFVYPVFNWGDIVEKFLSKAGGREAEGDLGKKIKMGRNPYKGCL